MKNANEKLQELEFFIKHTLSGKENSLKCEICSRLGCFISPRNATTAFETGKAFPYFRRHKENRHRVEVLTLRPNMFSLITNETCFTSKTVHIMHMCCIARLHS